MRFTPEALAQGQAAADLLEEGAREDVPIYGINRGNGSEREIAATRAARIAIVHDRDYFGARAGALPEIDEEDLVRAVLAIQANHLPYNAGSAAYMQAMIDLLNHDVTPVMFSRGSIGEGDLPLTSNLHATLLGQGDAYYRGHRMRASAALAKAGLKPFTQETGKVTSNALASAQAAFLVLDARRALEWSDLDLAMAMLAFNSSVTPIASGVQAGRPFAWVNWQADKLMAMLRDSYLMQLDPSRVLQDAESTRAAYIRLGSAWEAWAGLRDALLLQINSREQNPSVLVDAKPKDSWAMATPWVMQYHVRGGPASKGRSGYILSDANWDPYPLAGKVEAFNLAFADMAVTVASRIDHYDSPFFTGTGTAKILTAEQMGRMPTGYGYSFVYVDLWREMQSMTQPLTPGALSTDSGVADVEALSRLKAYRGRQAVDLYMQLLGYDVLAATSWMDLRKLQAPARSFGAAPTAAWTSLRRTVPFQMAMKDRPDIPVPVAVYGFMKSHPARDFMGEEPGMPPTAPLPTAR